MKVKTILKFYFTSIRVANMKISESEDVKNENSYSLLVGV